jgi:hypothetical protein
MAWTVLLALGAYEPVIEQPQALLGNRRLQDILASGRWEQVAAAAGAGPDSGAHAVSLV